jgi:deoxyribodipyrimidine photo-lyase
MQAGGGAMATKTAAGAAAAAAADADTCCVWWVRNDLRLADNEALLAATGPNVRYLLPVLCLDPAADLAPRRRGASGGGGGASGAAGVPLAGPHRVRLLLEAAHSLNADLSALGSGLAWRLAPAAAALPAALRQLAPALRPAGVSRVQLLLHASPDATAATLEQQAAVAAAFEREARRLGLAPAVLGFWGSTLYHPDDLLAAFSGGKGPAKSSSGGSSSSSVSEQKRLEEEHAWWGSDASTAPNADPRRYSSLPRVMTEFRRCVQSAAATQPPRPGPVALPPLPPLAAEQLSPQPESAAATAAAVDWFQPLPADVYSVYEAAGPEALAALRRLAALTNRPELARPGAVVPRYAAATAAPGSSSGPPAVAAEGSAFPFQGGEGAARARLVDYLSRALVEFGETRMQAVGVDASTKLSPFLALGCLTPRQIEAAVREHQQTQRQEQQGARSSVPPPPTAAVAAEQPAAELGRSSSKPGRKNKGRSGSGSSSNPSEGGEWLVMHLIIRDFFIFTALKAGDALVTTGTAAFQQQQAAAGGSKGGAPAAGGASQAAGAEWKSDPEAFAKWAAGQTGFPFVDAVCGWESSHCQLQSFAPCVHRNRILPHQPARTTTHHRRPTEHARAGRHRVDEQPGAPERCVVPDKGAGGRLAAGWVFELVW